MERDRIMSVRNTGRRERSLVAAVCTHACWHERLTLTGLAGLAVGHVVENVLHGPAVGQGTGPHLAVGLFAPLALVRMEQQDQLLLDQLALLRVGCRSSGNTLTPDHSHCHLLLRLGLHTETDTVMLVHLLGTINRFRSSSQVMSRDICWALRCTVMSTECLQVHPKTTEHVEFDINQEKLLSC